jgi:hypothetical protein
MSGTRMLNWIGHVNRMNGTRMLNWIGHVNRMSGTRIIIIIIPREAD